MIDGARFGHVNVTSDDWCYATDPDGNIVELQAWST
jgi:hypothetical protein